MLLRGFMVLAVLLTATAGSIRAGAVATRASGGAMCVLTPQDFAKFGTVVDSASAANVDDGGKSVYCVYRGKSGATGGVELDVFFPAGDTPDSVQQTFKTVAGSDPGAKYVPENLKGADESIYSLNVPQAGHFPFAANAVRRGDLVFSISLPSSPVAKIELQRLSQIVLARLAH